MQLLRKFYTAPTAEIILLEGGDVLTESPGGLGVEEDTDEGWGGLLDPS